MVTIGMVAMAVGFYLLPLMRRMSILEIDMDLIPARMTDNVVT
jgi:hypothetical protein